VIAFLLLSMDPPVEDEIFYAFEVEFNPPVNDCELAVLSVLYFY
jgi:hypothetical protein